MSVLTWSRAPDGGPALRSERLRRLEESHHAMWNYTTYRDAIALVGFDAAELYPAGATRLDPAVWADLGWLTCFAGPPASAVAAMRDAVAPESLSQYTPDLIEPLRDAAAALLGRERGAGFEVVGAEGAQAAIALTLLTTIDPGDEVIISDPGYFHIPSAIIAAGGVPVSVPIGPATAHRLDPDRVEAAITPRTRAVCIVDPVNPFGTVQTEDELRALAALADRHDLLLLHDVTHAALAIDPDVPHVSLPGLDVTERAVAMLSVSHCWGMAGARLGFLGGPPRLMRDCLRMKAAVTRLNTNLIAADGRNPARARRSRSAGQGPLHRQFEFSGLAHCRSRNDGAADERQPLRLLPGRIQPRGARHRKRSVAGGAGIQARTIAILPAGERASDRQIPARHYCARRNPLRQDARLRTATSRRATRTSSKSCRRLPKSAATACSKLAFSWLACVRKSQASSPAPPASNRSSRT